MFSLHLSVHLLTITTVFRVGHRYLCYVQSMLYLTIKMSVRIKCFHSVIILANICKRINYTSLLKISVTFGESSFLYIRYILDCHKEKVRVDLYYIQNYSYFNYIIIRNYVCAYILTIAETLTIIMVCSFKHTSIKVRYYNVK